MNVNAQDRQVTYSQIDRCRVCGNRNLVPILSLGDQYLTGVFPSNKDHLSSLTHGPLELVKCHDDSRGCGLLQLRQSYSPAEMYGANYGYRSALNSTMIDHLHAKVRRLTSIVPPEPDDWVVDIGSNDSTLLQAYRADLNLVGFDPVGEKFRKYYPEHIQYVPDFFSAMRFKDVSGGRKAKIITSIAMFYDLDDPLSFMREVHDILSDDGVWLTEQSYMPAMLQHCAYDTICHEHLEYYGIAQIEWMASRVGFHIIDVEINDVNGGSFSVMLSKKQGSFDMAAAYLLFQEQLTCPAIDSYFTFSRNVEKSRHDINDLIANIKTSGQSIYGLGASTKGNVILQHCGITETELPFVGDVNADKFGCFTPGTRIPIISEDKILAMKPDCLLVLPWHFRRFFESNRAYKGAQLMFPLPTPTVVTSYT